MGLSVASIKKDFTKLCTPAQFYLVTSLFGIVLYLVNMIEHKDIMKTTFGIVLQSVLLIIWTCVLNWICSLKHGNKLAWFLVLLPIILVIILLIILYTMMDKVDLSKEELIEILEQDDREEDDKEEGFCGDCM